MNLHLYPSALQHETRILKIVRSLRSYGVFDEISVVGLASTDLPAHEDLGDGIQVFRLAPMFRSNPKGIVGKAIRTLVWYIEVLAWVRGHRVECLNCHSLPVLPLAVILKLWKRCVLLYDTHELETETSTLKGLRQMLAKWVEGTLIGYCDAVCVVNRSIAAWYQKTYALRHVWVVHNLPLRMSTPPEPTGLLRKAIALNPPDALLFIYQGILSSGRGIEVLLDVFSTIGSDRHLVCMGYGPLSGRVQQAAQQYPNIHFMPAVSPDLVKDYTVDADVGLALIENTCLSYYFCAPNKLYEYALCGVAPVVSDFPEMAQFIDTYDCGWKVEPTPLALRRLIDSITPKVLAAKRTNAARAGTQCYWENEETELLQMYEALNFRRQAHQAILPNQ